MDKAKQQQQNHQIISEHELINKSLKFPQNKFTAKALATSDPFRYDLQW